MLVHEQFSVGNVDADAPAAEISVPATAKHSNEAIWYGIVADDANDVELVKAAGETSGLPIPAGSGLSILGPFHLNSVLNGTVERFLYAAAPTTVRVVVYRSG